MILSRQSFEYHFCNRCHYIWQCVSGEKGDRCALRFLSHIVVVHELCAVAGKSAGEEFSCFNSRRCQFRTPLKQKTACLTSMYQETSLCKFSNTDIYKFLFSEVNGVLFWMWAKANKIQTWIRTEANIWGVQEIVGLRGNFKGMT